MLVFRFLGFCLFLVAISANAGPFKVVEQYTGRSSPIQMMDFSPSGKHFFTIDKNGNLKVFSRNSTTPIFERTLIHKKYPVNIDRRNFQTIGGEHPKIVLRSYRPDTVRIQDMKTGEILREYSGASLPSRFFHSGHFIVDGKPCYLVHPQEAGMPAEIGHDFPDAKTAGIVKILDLDHSNQTELYKKFLVKDSQFFDPTTGRLVQDLMKDPDYAHATTLALSPDNDWLLTGHSNGTVKLWSLEADDKAPTPPVIMPQEHLSQPETSQAAL